PAAVGAERQGMRIATLEGERPDLRPGLRAPEPDHAGSERPVITPDSPPLPIGAERDGPVAVPAGPQLPDAARHASPDVDRPSESDRDEIAAIGAERDRGEGAVVVVIGPRLLVVAPLEVAPFPVAKRDGALVEQLVGPVGVVRLAVTVRQRD